MLANDATHQVSLTLEKAALDETISHADFMEIRCFYEDGIQKSLFLCLAFAQKRNPKLAIFCPCLSLLKHLRAHRLMRV